MFIISIVFYKDLLLSKYLDKVHVLQEKYNTVSIQVLKDLYNIIFFISKSNK